MTTTADFTFLGGGMAAALVGFGRAHSGVPQTDGPSIDGPHMDGPRMDGPPRTGGVA